MSAQVAFYCRVAQGHSRCSCIKQTTDMLKVNKSLLLESMDNHKHEVRRDLEKMLESESDRAKKLKGLEVLAMILKECDNVIEQHQAIHHYYYNNDEHMNRLAHADAAAMQPAAKAKFCAWYETGLLKHDDTNKEFDVLSMAQV